MSFTVPSKEVPSLLRGCLRAMSGGGGSLTPDGTYDSVWNCVWPMTGRYNIDYFQYQGDVGCVCMLNDWISSNDEICAVIYNYSRFKLKGKCRSEKWEVYLYVDKTIKVDSRFKLKGTCRSEKWKVYLYGDKPYQGGA